MMIPKQSDDGGDEDEDYWMHLVLCEEDRRRKYPTSLPSVGFRWFRSPNVVCIEKYRQAKSG
jgi:hypothetical protein